MPILEPTVLVLGAGASSEFGFPLGIQLRNEVCAALESRGTIRLLPELGHAEAEIERFSAELRYSGYRSVDIFLEENPKFLEIGKQAIAACLLPYEDERRLFPPGGPTNHWYEYLAAVMGIGTEDWARNRLSIVTFNYDRSLEHYFTRVIAQRRRLPLDAAHEVFSRVPVLHVHGSLGAYPGSAEGGLEYGAHIRAETLARVAQHILVVSEATDTLPTFDEAFRYLSDAERIYFLGFGFHPANVRRLRRFNEPPSGGRRIEVGGTNQGYSDREWEVVAEGLLHSNWTGGFYRATTYEFLTQQAILR